MDCQRSMTRFKNILTNINSMVMHNHLFELRTQSKLIITNDSNAVRNGYFFKG